MAHYIRYYPDRPLRSPLSSKPQPKKRGRSATAANAELYKKVLAFADGTLTTADIAEKLKVSPEKVRCALRALRAAGHTPTFKESVFKQDVGTEDRNQEILSMLNDGFTQQEVGEHFGVSRVRVFQIKSRADKKNR